MTERGTWGLAEDTAEDRLAGSKRKSRAYPEEGSRGQDCWKLAATIKGPGWRGVGGRWGKWQQGADWGGGGGLLHGKQGLWGQMGLDLGPWLGALS